MDATTQVTPQALLDQNPDAVVYAGTDGVIQYWNAAAERIFGFAAADAVGQNLDIIIPEAFRDRHWTGYDRALAAGETKYRGQSLPTKAQKADGSEFYVELSFEIVKDAAGTVIGAMATARDITERFQRDRDLRREMRELKEQVGRAGPTP
ncbi:MAG: PAS domain S-box protein [Dehalococcoidia bacterium]